MRCRSRGRVEGHDGVKFGREVGYSARYGGHTAGEADLGRLASVYYYYNYGSSQASVKTQNKGEGSPSSSWEPSSHWGLWSARYRTRPRVGTGNPQESMVKNTSSLCGFPKLEYSLSTYVFLRVWMPFFLILPAERQPFLFYFILYRGKRR